MANYEEDENTLGEVISSMPGQIMKYLEFGQTAKHNRQRYEQNQTAIDIQRKQLGMDKGAYGNKELDAYFRNLTLSPIDIRPGADGWTVDAGTPLPTSAEAWAQYESMVGSGNITASDTDHFMQVLYPRLIETRAAKINAAFDNLSKQGFNVRDIKLMMMNQPGLQSDIGLVNQYLGEKDPTKFGPTIQKLSSYLPQKNVNPMESITRLAPFAGGAAMLGGYGYQTMQATSPTDIKKAKEFSQRFLERTAVSGKDNIIDPTTRTSTNIQKAEKALEKVKKINAKTKKGKANKATRIKNLENQIKTEKTSTKKVLERAKNIEKRKISDKTYWKRAMKKLPKNKLLNFPVVSLAPAIAESTGQVIAGDKGGILGRGLGGGLQATYGAAKGLSLSKYLMKEIPKIALKKTAQGVAIGMADTPVPGPADVAGMVWGLGSGSYEIYKAYQDWKLANQGY